MPPLILVLAGIIAGGALLRLGKRERDRVNRELQDARERTLDQGGRGPPLRRDSESGAYRPE